MENRKFLQNRAYEYILNIILDNKLEDGQIYSQTQAASQIGVSRTPMRDALQRLEQEGALIEKGWDQARQELGQSREREAALEGSLRSLKQQAEETALPDLTGQLEKQRLLKQKGQELSKNLRTAGSRLDQNLNILEHLEAQSRQQPAIEKR